MYERYYHTPSISFSFSIDLIPNSIYYTNNLNSQYQDLDPNSIALIVPLVFLNLILLIYNNQDLMGYSSQYFSMSSDFQVRLVLGNIQSSYELFQFQLASVPPLVGCYRDSIVQILKLKQKFCYHWLLCNYSGKMKLSFQHVIISNTYYLRFPIQFHPLLYLTIPTSLRFDCVSLSKYFLQQYHASTSLMGLHTGIDIFRKLHWNILSS